MKNILKGTLLATAMAATANMQAATTVTTVDVSFPQVLVLYTWDTIELDVTAAGAAAFLEGDALTACPATDDFCLQLDGGAALDLTGSALNLAAPTVDAGMAAGSNNADANKGSTVITGVTISNAVGVRSIGYGTAYSATATVGAQNDLGSTNGNTSITGNITTDTPSINLSLGNLVFDIDLDGLDASANLTTDFNITVTGS